MPERFRDLPKSLKLYDLALLCLALALSIWAIPRAHFPIVMWLIGIFMVACIVRPIPHPYGGIIHPISGIVQVAGLLWQPEDVLLAVGIGCFWGLLLFQRAGLFRARSNAAGWAVSALAAALVAHRILSGISPILLSVAAAALFSNVTNHLINKTIFAVYRNLRFGYLTFEHLHASLISRFLDELFPLPMIAALAWAASLLGDVGWGLVLTAAYLLVLPIPRQKAKDCFRAQELMGEIAEEALSAPSQSGQVGSSTGLFVGPFRRLRDRCSASPALAGLASAGPVAVNILAAAEAYDKMHMILGSLPRSVSCEDIEREFINLTGTNPDPSIVPVLLRVAENAKRSHL